jgi:poly-gamma-glutamate capsule biosynthesis protein CapA/YwtB (metallophosphatase superfamily)
MISTPPARAPISLVLGGDVMTGRGIDQILPHPVSPAIFESHLRDARDYVELAAAAAGAFPRPVPFRYGWGDALPALLAADVRIVNLETSVTEGGEPWPAKGIHYRMHPRNVECLTAARLDGCGLANNHVLDWGYGGLEETLRTLRAAGIATAGAGSNGAAAAAPMAIPVPDKGRVWVAALGSPCSGVPPEWAASPDGPGIKLVRTLDASTARRVAHGLRQVSRPDDVSVVSIHWGGNWGHEITAQQIAFAHVLADEGIDVIHGHSAHHAKAVEVRHGSVILYGCGDLINDYEGITGREEYGGDLAVLCRVDLGPRPRPLPRVELDVFRRRKLRLELASDRDTEWLGAVLNEQSGRFATAVAHDGGHTLSVQPRPPPLRNGRAVPLIFPADTGRSSSRRPIRPGANP